MKRRFVGLSVLLPVVAAGCSTGRVGVVRRLPPPIDPVRREPRRIAVRPVPPPAIPRLPLTASVEGERGWRPRGGVKDRWRSIVIHHSGSRGGDARTFDEYHRKVKRWDELGYHFVIGNGTGSGNGEVEVGSRWSKQKHGAHCKTPGNYFNDHGIGICLVGDFGMTAPTAAQMASVRKLVRFLMRECGIRPGNVVAHGAVTGKTACPGPRFPLLAFRRSVSDYHGSGAGRSARSAALAAP